MSRARINKFLIAVLIVSCFVPMGESLHTGFWSAASDGFHVPLFFVLVILADQVLRRPLPALAPRLAALFVSAFAAAALIEIIQPYFDRSESLIDLENGTIGITLALAFIAVRGLPQSAGRAKKARAWLMLLLAGTAVFGVVCIPVMEFHRLGQIQAARFPVLSSIGSGLERLSWEPYGGARLKFLGPRSGVRIDFGSKNFSGAEFTPPRLSWRGYQFLRLEVIPSGRPVEFWIRIDDSGPSENRTDRYERQQTLSAGNQTLVIPIGEIENSPQGRKINLDSIKRILLFTAADSSAPTQPSGITVRRMMLVR